MIPDYADMAFVSTLLGYRNSEAPTWANGEASGGAEIVNQITESEDTCKLKN